MSDPSVNRITINKSDLLRLCVALDKALPDASSVPGFAAGWTACVEATRMIAETMPDGCFLVRGTKVPRDSVDGLGPVARYLSGQ